MTVPAGITAVGNGRLLSQRTAGGRSTFVWHESKPMATYLAMAAIGRFDVTSYRRDGIRFVDGIDPALPPATYQRVAKSFAREPEILRFLSGYFGPYPFAAAGGIVDADGEWGYALENQGRPIYTPQDFGTQEDGDSVVVHELAHQWYGDSVALDRWADIWLNEGFATYAEWLWSEHDGLATTQEIFDNFAGIPADDEFWTLRIGDPGPDQLFEIPVYWRGGMTLHALRLKIGDRDFFRLVKRWVSLHSGGNVTTPEFIRLAERVSGQDLGDFFQTWLFTPEKPAGITRCSAAAKLRSEVTANSRAMITTTIQAGTTVWPLV